ncbi:apolipoprotein L5 [Hyaena hyaena]|uniref:apolipoprotein L5 n=1 Tax=Hyaena hyaena TaxID=95912 RepID=UPI00192374DE|nr:apolipoprotein L5 [Hyaena hyaena]
MQYILFHPEVWEQLVDRSGLDRDEANILYYIMMEELTQHKEASMPGDLSEEEKLFLLCFPLQKHKLEKSIKELHAIADEVDATRKMLAKTSLVASSSGTVSGVLSILGLALVPVTVGGSLMLSVAGLGLGAAAAVTNVLTSVLENRSNMEARERASSLVPLQTTIENKALEDTRLYDSVVCVDRCVRLFKKVKELRAYQVAKANSSFMTKVYTAISHLPFWRAGRMQRAAEASVLSLSKGVRVLGAVGTGLFLLQDVQDLLQSWKHLEEGARAETAEELLSLAKELEQRLRQLTRRYRRTLQGRGCRRGTFRKQEGRTPPAQPHLWLLEGGGDGKFVKPESLKNDELQRLTRVRGG